VVERILGKAEVGSSILPGGTIPPAGSFKRMATPPRPDPDPAPGALKGDPAREARLAQALRANLRRRKTQLAKDADR
jgi:hypothetical protein